YEQAASHFERALHVLNAHPTDNRERCTRLLALGDAQQRAGEATAARETFERAASEARRLGASDLLAQVALGYGGAGVQTGLVDERLVELLEEALTALGDDRGTGAEPRSEGVGEGVPTAGDVRRWGGAGPHGFPNSQKVRLLARLAMELYWSDARERRIALSGEAVELGRRVGDASALAFALSARHLAFWEPENVEERLAVGAEHLRVVASTGDRQMMLQGYARRIPDLLQVGDIIATEQAIESHARLADELRQPLYQWESLRFRALTAYLHGRFGEMEQTAREALALAERAQIGGVDVLFVAHLQFLRREQGRYSETEAPMKAIMARYPLLRDGWRNTLANLYAQTGRTVEAQREIDALAADGFEAVGRSLPALGIMALLTEAIAALGDARAAVILYPRLEPYAGHYIVNAAAPNFYGAAAHYLGMLAATMSRWDDAIAHFESALVMNTRTGVPTHVVSTQVEYAKALLSAGRSTRDADALKAREMLDAALTSARELGMNRICDQIAQLRQGERSTQTTAPTALNAGLPAGLTPRETEVLGLLASGMSNQEIAEALVVTVNTVERHLVSVYGKLGVRGRAAATAYAHRHGLA
ncbi:MAG: LuxR C-terminal-related transcriptional regulator, partial [Dehalococcoidia bacterium]